MRIEHLRRSRLMIAWLFLWLAFFAALILAVSKVLESEPIEEWTKVRKCRFCAEAIRWEAAVCKHCGRDVPRFKRAPGPWGRTVGRPLNNATASEGCAGCSAPPS